MSLGSHAEHERAVNELKVILVDESISMWVEPNKDIAFRWLTTLVYAQKAWQMTYHPGFQETCQINFRKIAQPKDRIPNQWLMLIDLWPWLMRNVLQVVQGIS
jgi:hypothetical protein